MRWRLRPSLNWLLLLVPLTLSLRYASPGSNTLIFFCACGAIIPLAGWLGRATEHLAEKTTESIGGLLNATFGNAAELIIAAVALRKGLHAVVKASLTGSIIGNILLVLGAAVLAGGVKYKVQRFNPAGARAQSTMLTLAAIALILPAAFHYLVRPRDGAVERDLSLEISIVLLITYGLSLLFSLHTHKQLFTSAYIGGPAEAARHRAPWPVRTSLAVLLVSSGLVAAVSEVLVGSIEATAHALGMTNTFVGVIVVAIVGNAAEHSTAVQAAIKNRMDLSLTIAIGSSIQVALFVAPLLVLASYAIGPRPMDLVFTPPEVIAIVLAIAITSQISNDGESNWLEGAQLLAVYLILGIVFYFLPEMT